MQFIKKCLPVLSVVLLLTLCLAFFAPEAEAAEITASGTCGDNLTWTLDSEGTLTISGTGDMEDYWQDAPWYSYRSLVRTVVIESGVANVGDFAFYGCRSLESITIPDSVTSIDYCAFHWCDSLESITIPDSVTSIGDYAFYICGGLTSVTIGDSVTSIGDHAFFDCGSLESITIPDSVTSIGDCAFYYCRSLESITIPDSVTSIGDSAFCCCYSLTSVTIGDSVTSIGDFAFSDCSNLTGIWVDAKNPSYSSDSFGVLFNKDKRELIVAPEAISGSYVIPDGVTNIEQSAFSDCSSLESITIPDSVTSIGGHAFSDCSSLESITIPDSVTRIEDYAFNHCNSLKHVLYTGTEGQWSSISKGTYNTNLTNATRHHEAAGDEIYWTKNCINSGWYCEICDQFITKESAESGTHSYEDNTDSECNDCGFIRPVKSISMYSYPTLREYNLFEGVLDVIGGVLRITYNDGVSYKADMTLDMVSGFDNSVLGTQTLTVAYDGKTTSYTVKVIPENPDELTIATLPDNRNYITGASLDLAGLTLNAVYEGREPIAVSLTDVTVDPVDMTTAGVKTVTLRLGDGTATFEIYVHEKTKQPIDASLYPESSHNYASNANETKTFTYAGADSLTLTFSSSSYTESNYDFVYLYDGEGIQIGKYSGSLSGKVVTIPGDTFQIRLTSDGSVNKYGYAFSSIVAETILHPEQIAPGADPSCTESGLSAGSKCGICSMVLAPQEEIPALGHSYENGACTLCGAADPEHTAPKFNLVGANVDLGNALGMNFFIDKGDITDESYYVEIVKENDDGTTSVTTVPAVDFKDYYGIYWQASLKGLEAKEMADAISVTVYNGDGVAVSNPWKDSMRAYCVRQLGNPIRSSAYTLLVDMLNYGAAAQLNFGYNTDDLANSTLTAEQAAYATQNFDLSAYSNNMVGGDNYFGSSLSLETNIVLGMYFSKPASSNGLVAKVSYTDHMGVAQIIEIPEADFVDMGALYGVNVNTLVASDVRQLVTLEVYDGDTLVASGADSMESYAVRQGGAMNTALMIFTLSAYDYLH